MPPVISGAALAHTGAPYRAVGSAHSAWGWRDQRHLLRLQRGEPVMYMNGDDAHRRGLADHDRARVFNDTGAFVIRVKPSPPLQPGQVVIYHAVEVERT